MRIYSQEKQFYVYSYLRDNGTPYYIGKGKDNRAYHKTSGIRPPKDKSKIRIICESMNEADAFQVEMLLIRLYGRKDIGSGCLRNMTDGGEGSSGLIQTEESNKKRSLAIKGTQRGPQSEEHKLNNSKSHIGQQAWNKGKKTGPLSEETKLKQSLAHKGRTTWNKGISPSLETRLKQSKTTKGRKGRPHTQEDKDKISIATKGRIPWNKGKKTNQVPWNKGKSNKTIQ